MELPARLRSRIAPPPEEVLGARVPAIPVEVPRLGPEGRPEPGAAARGPAGAHCCRTISAEERRTSAYWAPVDPSEPT